MNINRILIVGSGSAGKKHFQTAKLLLPDADIRYFRSGITNLIKFENEIITIEDAINFQANIVVIANPSSLHIEYAFKLAENFSHFLIEKPLSSSISGVSDFLKLCEKRNSVVMTGYNLRYFLSLKDFKDRIDRKIFGKVLSIRCEVGQYLPSWRPSTDYRNGVSANKALGGGVLLELSHEFDYLRWIFGEAYWVNCMLLTKSDLEIDVEDCAHLLIGFKELGLAEEVVASINLDFFRQDSTRLCLAICENGSIRWNGVTCEVEEFDILTSTWNSMFVESSHGSDSILAEWKDFLHCISTGDVPRSSGLDGLKVLEIIEAARISNSQNLKVKVTH